MKEECLLCGAPLAYLETDEIMECAVCHKKENSKTKCVNGHYVCNECHTRGMDAIIGLCLKESSKDPVKIVKKLMDQPFCHMHGPEHHVMVGAALLAAYKNAGGDIELHQALVEMMNRGKSVPGGACGFWGACGAGISTGRCGNAPISSPWTGRTFSLSPPWKCWRRGWSSTTGTTPPISPAATTKIPTPLRARSSTAWTTGWIFTRPRPC